MATKLYYDASKNPDGAFFSGIPLGDISEEKFNSLAEWEQQSLMAQPYYRKSPVPKPKAPVAGDGAKDGGEGVTMHPAPALVVVEPNNPKPKSEG